MKKKIVFPKLMVFVVLMAFLVSNISFALTVPSCNEIEGNDWSSKDGNVKNTVVKKFVDHYNLNAVKIEADEFKSEDGFEITTVGAITVKLTDKDTLDFLVDGDEAVAMVTVKAGNAFNWYIYSSHQFKASELTNTEINLNSIALYDDVFSDSGLMTPSGKNLSHVVFYLIDTEDEEDVVDEDTDDEDADDEDADDEDVDDADDEDADDEDADDEDADDEDADDEDADDEDADDEDADDDDADDEDADADDEDADDEDADDEDKEVVNPTQSPTSSPSPSPTPTSTPTNNRDNDNRRDNRDDETTITNNPVPAGNPKALGYDEIYVPLTVIEEVGTPQGKPTTEDEEVEDFEDIIPAGLPTTLPSTSGIPAALFYGTGTALAALGLAIRRK